jgi:hypothetical protein
LRSGSCSRTCERCSHDPLVGDARTTRAEPCVREESSTPARQLCVGPGRGPARARVAIDHGAALDWSVLLRRPLRWSRCSPSRRSLRSPHSPMSNCPGWRSGTLDLHPSGHAARGAQPGSRPWRAITVLSPRSSLVGVPIWKVLPTPDSARALQSVREAQAARLVACPSAARARRVLRSQSAAPLVAHARPLGSRDPVLARLRGVRHRPRPDTAHADVGVAHRGWEPGVELSAIGSNMRAPSLTGPLSPAGTPFALPKVEGFATGYAIPHASAVSRAMICVARVADYARAYPQADSIPDLRVALLPQDLAFEVQAPGTDVHIRSFQTSVEGELPTFRSVTRLNLDFPAYAERSTPPRRCVAERRRRRSGAPRSGFAR